MLSPDPHKNVTNVADPDSGSSSFFTYGPGIEKQKRFRSGIWDKPKNISSYFPELSNHFLVKNI
jgi:hypothetical protein